MLFSNSPVKKVVEKLNPFSQKNKISRLRFERKSDYKTFLKFVKDNTKEIEDIKIPDPEDKKRKGLLIGGGILGLALLASLGRGDDDDSGTPRKIGEVKNLNDVLRKVKADKKRVTPADKSRQRLSTISRITKIFKKTKPLVKESIEAVKEARKIKKQQVKVKKSENKQKNRTVNKKYSKQQQNVDQQTARRNNQSTTVTDVDGNTTNTKKSSTATIDNNQGKQGPTGGTRGRSGANQPNLSEFERMVKRAGEIDKRIKAKLNDPNFRVPDKIKKEINYINKRLNERDLRPSTRKRLTDRLSNINKNIKEIQKQNKKFKSSKFFEAPEIPKNETKKLTRLDRFTRGVNKFYSKVMPIGSFLSSPKNYFRFMLIKDMLKIEPLADGTLNSADAQAAGAPLPLYNSEQLMFDEDMAVNIFMPSEERESMIPFDADIETPLVTTPTDLQAPNNSVFIDYDFNTSEDLFFIKMAGS